MGKNNTRMKKIIFLNGKFVPADEARVSILEPGFLHGVGLFETMHFYKGRIIYLDAHLKRLKESSALLRLRLPYSLSELKKVINKAVKINGFADSYVRLTLWEGKNKTQISVIVKKYYPYHPLKYRRGFKVCISRYRQNDSITAQVKSVSRLLYEASYRQAKEKGYDEALILNSRGDLAECSRSNIFLVKNETLFTPSLGCGCLPGITRRAVIDLAKKYNIMVYEGKFTPRDLAGAEEAFLTNSLMGIMPVNKCGKTTAFLIRKYNSLLK